MGLTLILAAALAALVLGQVLQEVARASARLVLQPAIIEANLLLGLIQVKVLLGEDLGLALLPQFLSLMEREP